VKVKMFKTIAQFVDKFFQKNDELSQKQKFDQALACGQCKKATSLR